MIATLTLNPSLDVVITVHGLAVDEVNRWTNLHLYAGGKGVDVSRAIHEMGGRTVAFGFIGGSAGRQLEILLDEEGVPYMFTPIKGETRTNFIITDTKASTQTRIDAPGPRTSKREFERFHRRMTEIHPKPSLVVAGGSVPPSLAVDIYFDIITEVTKFGVRSILDSEGQWLKDGIKAKPYLIKPNVREAEILLKRELPSEESIIEAALELLETDVEVIVISTGKNGLIAATKERIVKAVPPDVRVRSTVGAGDCTVAGLALKLVHNEPLVEACHLAVAMGTAAVLTPGTELCHKADVDRLLPQVKVCETTTKEWLKTRVFAASGSKGVLGSQLSF